MVWLLCVASDPLLLAEGFRRMATLTAKLSYLEDIVQDVDGVGDEAMAWAAWGRP
jgi:hypothetical protein